MTIIGGIELFGVDLGLYGPQLLDGALRALSFTVVSFTAAAVLGLTVALLRGSRLRVARVPAVIYTEVIKNTPVLTGIFVTYFGLSSAGVTLSAFQAGCLSLGIFYGAYLAEIFRGGLAGVGHGQREAAEAVGLTSLDVTRFVVVPQAMRLALPGAGTMLVDLLKVTSLLVTIGGAELMTVGQNITSVTFQPLGVYTLIGIIYLSMCFPLSHGVGTLERVIKRGTPIARRRRRLHQTIGRAFPDAELVAAREH